MAFPVSLRGEVTLDFAADLSQVTDSVRRALLAQKPLALTVSGDRIFFRGGLGAGGLGNWHLLQPISEGTVQFHSVRPKVILRYELRFQQMLTHVSLMVFGFGAPVLIFLAGVRAVDVAAASSAAWLWLFGVNYAISATRFRAFLRRTVLAVRP